jgi:nucleoside-diphosphate-sugar epimerase
LYSLSSKIEYAGSQKLFVEGSGTEDFQNKKWGIYLDAQGNIANKVAYSVNEIYALVSKLLKIQIEPIRKPDLPGEAQVTLADITAARTLGWEPKTNIETGLRKAISYIRSELEKGNI